MKKNKLLCLLLCVVMVASLVMPGTWAMETKPTETQTVETTEATSEPTTVPTESQEPTKPDPTEGAVETVPVTTEAKETEPDTTEAGKKEETEPNQESTEATVPETTEETEKTCTCGAAEGEDHKEDCALYVAPTTEEEKPFDVEAAYKELLALGSDEEREAYLLALDEEDAMALLEYVQQHGGILPAPFKGINYTNVAPISSSMVSPMRVARKAPRNVPVRTETPGVETSKVVTANEDGTYTIRLESYVTGATTTVTSSKPTDIVLVLDTSGSMDEYINVADKNSVANLDPKYASYYKWNGGLIWHDMRYQNGKWQYQAVFGNWKDCGSSWFGNAAGIKKIDALKIACDEFIDSVNAQGGDNNIAIVTYAGSANIRNDLTSVSTGSDALKNTINGLTANGATAADYGMNNAKSILDGVTRDSNKVVIMFTDGEPNHGNGFDTTVANSAISTAGQMKAKGVTVYSIAVHENADPKDLNANLNKYMHYVSSNYPSAKSMTNGGSLNPVASPFNGGKSYYLTAGNSESLTEIFQSISQEVGGATVKLDSSTVLQDQVSSYFKIPNGASDVTVKVADCTGFNGDEPVWGADQPTSYVANIDEKDGKTVTVNGFDYAAHYVGKNSSTGNVHENAQKLILEIVVAPETGFVGGNDVPTNVWGNTGVHDKNGNMIQHSTDYVSSPTVNVPITQPVVTPHDKTIYEGNSTAVSGLYDQPEADGWQYDYVHVEPGIAGVTGDTVSPDDCTTYSVTITYKPKTDGTKSGKDGGTANAMTGVSDTKTATVHVLKPTVNVTVNDVEAAYGEDYTLGDKADAKVTSVNWTDKTDGHTNIPVVEAGTTEPYTKDDLTFAYECVDKTITVTDGKITVPDKDVDVTVTVKHGDTVLTDAIITTTCTIQDSGCTTPDTDKIYTVHVTSCKLTIKKAGKAYDASDSFIFDIFDKDNNKVATVTLHMDKEITISGLKKGTYTVSERTTGTRYNDQKAQEVNLTPKGYTVTFTNSVKTDTWLTNSDSEHNVFNGMPTDKG